jgi:hypothetical protein
MHYFFAAGFSVFILTSSLLEYWKLSQQSLLVNVELSKKTQFVLVEDERFLQLSNNFSNAFHWKMVYDEERNAMCLCDNNNESKVEPLATSYSSVLLDYYYRDEIPKFFQSHENLYSCMIFDMISNKMTLISDNIGSRPLFYSITGSEEENKPPKVFMTSDLLLGFQLGISHMNSVPSQHYITLNVTSGSIINLKSTVFSSPHFEHSQELEIFPNSLLSSVINSINNSLLALNFSKETDSLILEDNELMWSNNLLRCSVNRLNLPVQSRKIKAKTNSEFERNSTFKVRGLIGTVHSFALSFYFNFLVDIIQETTDKHRNLERFVYCLYFFFFF